MTQERIRIRMEAYDHAILDLSAVDIVNTAKRTGADVRGPVPVAPRLERYTVPVTDQPLKGPKTPPV